jgi:hypothetical protein
MKKRGALMFLSVLVLAIALGPLAAAEEAAAKDAPKATYDPHSRPPKDLHQMPDGHWTPWDPPMPPEGSKVHVITKGDTLWGLGQQYLGNPYLWPQIWDQNRYVLDSHWIYPGDALVVPSPEVVPAQLPQTPAASAAPRGGEGTRQAEAPAPPPKPSIYPMGDYQDNYCVAFVQDEPIVAPAIVAPDEDDMQSMAQGHVVYLNAGTAEGFNPGDRFLIVRDSGMLKHPATHANIGHRIDWKGQLMLIAVQEHTATAEVTFSCEDLKRGDMVLPFKEVSIPTQLTRVNSNLKNRWTNMGSGKTEGFVILSRDEQIALGQGNIVGVDMGPSDVHPGDTLTIFRDNRTSPGVLPRQNLGEGVVLRTEGLSAIVRISASVREIYVGDRAEIR